MTASRTGWSWFDRDDAAARGRAQDGLPDAGVELRRSYAKCFSGPDGEKVKRHMRALTLERALGPDTPARTLRHLEGQRQLVNYVLAQIERGRDGR